MWWVVTKTTLITSIKNNYKIKEKSRDGSENKLSRVVVMKKQYKETSNPTSSFKYHCLTSQMKYRMSPCIGFPSLPLLFESLFSYIQFLLASPSTFSGIQCINKWLLSLYLTKKLKSKMRAGTTLHSTCVRTWAHRLAHFSCSLCYCCLLTKKRECQGTLRQCEWHNRHLCPVNLGSDACHQVCNCPSTWCNLTSDLTTAVYLYMLVSLLVMTLLVMAMHSTNGSSGSMPKRPRKRSRWLGKWKEGGQI